MKISDVDVDKFDNHEAVQAVKLTGLLVGRAAAHKGLEEQRGTAPKGDALKLSMALVAAMGEELARFGSKIAASLDLAAEGHDMGEVDPGAAGKSPGDLICEGIMEALRSSLKDGREHYMREGAEAVRKRVQAECDGNA